MKTCLRCNLSKPLDAFGLSKRSADLRNCYCRECVNKRANARRQAFHQRFYWKGETWDRPQSMRALPTAQNGKSPRAIVDDRLSEGPATFDELWELVKSGYRRSYSEDAMSELIRDRILDDRSVRSYTVGDERYYELQATRNRRVA